ncbi:MAG TPA: hypothetical protein G4O01_08470 [Dehalococcoidia bacterium]|jgi:hypothetical protein|nr:hypothetical protein [Dehalococcoidia bacterium]
MALRGDKEQAEHDRVVMESASTFKKEGMEAYVNPGTEKNYSAKGLYPDVIVKKPDGSIIIEEIETESSVTQDECDTQWKPYLGLGYKFNLIVPASRVDVARRFIRGLDINLQTYTIIGNEVRFFT